MWSSWADDGHLAIPALPNQPIALRNIRSDGEEGAGDHRNPERGIHPMLQQQPAGRSAAPPQSPQGDVLIEFQHVSKIYQMGDEEVVRAVDDVSFKIRRGEFVALVGQSGSGKSTMMNIMGALDVPTSGLYYLAGEEIGSFSQDALAEFRNRMLGFVFQQYNLISKINVYENVELPLIYSSRPAEERRRRVYAALERVGLSDRVRHMPNQLSGGQQQRTSIARALANSPSVILADEPTGALDSRTGIEVMELLVELHGEGNTIVLITHNEELASKAPRILRMADGKLIFDSGSEEIPAGGEVAVT